jgi:cytochrome b pre-mRNA-processing protein 3
MSFLQRLFGGSAPDPREGLRPLYTCVVAKARELHWYEQGGVPDTLDGRFDMVSAILALVLLRMEEIPEAMQDSVYLTEIFVTDMDAQMREAGIGDVVVAKDMGKVMSALGGRIGAFRGSFNDEAKLRQAIERNIYEGAETSAASMAHATQKLREYMMLLATVDRVDLVQANFT